MSYDRILYRGKPYVEERCHTDGIRLAEQNALLEAGYKRLSEQCTSLRTDLAAARAEAERAKAVNEQLRQHLVASPDDRLSLAIADLKFVFSWLADLCLMIETTYEYQPLKRLQEIATAAHRLTLAHRHKYSLKTRGELEKGFPDVAYENPPANPCRTGETPDNVSLLRERGERAGLEAALAESRDEAEKAKAENAVAHKTLEEHLKTAHQWRVLYEGMGTNFGNRMAEYAAQQRLRADTLAAECESLKEQLRVARVSSPGAIPGGVVASPTATHQLETKPAARADAARKEQT